MKDLDVHMLTK